MVERRSVAPRAMTDTRIGNGKEANGRVIHKVNPREPPQGSVRRRVLCRNEAAAAVLVLSTPND
jgi:hypothetical protein